MVGEPVSSYSAEPRKTRLGAVLDAPEFNVALFAFLLNFVWEFIQVPYFQGMQEMSHWEGIRFCTGATIGDVVIALTCFWGVAIFRSRAWITRPERRDVVAFTVLGVVITVGIEWISVNILHRWAYIDTFPTLPVFGTGLTPLLQWILLPPLIVWFVKRQLT